MYFIKYVNWFVIVAMKERKINLKKNSDGVFRLYRFTEFKVPLRSREKKRSFRQK